MIGETLLESLTLLRKTVDKFNEKCIKTLKVDKERCLFNLEKSSSLITPLISIIGYDKASEIVKISQSKNISIKDVIISKKIFTKDEINILLEPYNITKPGVIKGGN
jgi:aspartate ammonia-lyase